MTVTDAERAPGPAAVVVPERKPRRDRRGWGVVGLVLVVWSIAVAGVDVGDIVNERGWVQFRRFFGAMFTPDLSPAMLQLTVREAGVTIGYALLGTALGVVIGSVGGVLLTERIWSPLAGGSGRGRAGWVLSRTAFAVPRAIHEVVFALLLINVLGLNPWVAVLAIGIPFGAITARVFADLLDEVPLDAERSLRAAGAGRITAFLFGTLPFAFNDLVSYAFYRLECALRSAAILGIIGAGGLGFQLALSFQSLRYDEMWTLLWALIILSALADWWSSAVRRRRRALTAETRIELPDDGVATTPKGDRFLRLSALACVLGVPIAAWALRLDVTTLWDARARRLGGELVRDSLPPRIGRGGWDALLSETFNTLAISILSIVLAFAIAAPLSFVAARSGGGLVRRAVAAVVRFVLLVSRSVPLPVWAFVFVFVLFPGVWPGAVALAVYNAGVLGRLQGEVLENRDHRPARVLSATGASPAGALTMATVPAVSGRYVLLGLYRWEVAIRESVIVGVVGAAGLGFRLDQQAATFDYDGIVATVLALFIITIVVDLASAWIKRAVR